MSNSKFRTVVRWGHLIEAAFIGVYLYSPLSANPVFSAIVLYVMFPLLGISGILLWQQPRILKWFKRSRNVGTAT